MQGNEAHSAGDLTAAGVEVLNEGAVLGEDDDLSAAAERHFQQGGLVDFRGEEFGDAAQDRIPGGDGSFPGAGEDLLDADADPFLAAFKVFQQILTGLAGAALFTVEGQIALGLLLLDEQVFAAVADVLQGFTVLADLTEGRFDADLPAIQVSLHDGDIAVKLIASHTGAFAAGLEGRELRIEAADSVLQYGDLLHQDQLTFALLIELFAVAMDGGGEVAEGLFAGLQFGLAGFEGSQDVSQVAVGLLEFTSRRRRAGLQFLLLLPQAIDFGLEFRFTSRLMQDGGFVGGGRFAVLGGQPFDNAQAVFAFGHLGIDRRLFEFDLLVFFGQTGQA